MYIGTNSMEAENYTKSMSCAYSCKFVEYLLKLNACY